MLIELIFQKTHLYLLNSRLFSTSMATVFSFVCAMALFPPYIAFLKKLNVNTEFETVKGRTDPVMPAGLLFLVIILATGLITARFNSYVISAL